MNVLILMAGEGKRFSDVGMTEHPKPFLEVNGKPIVEWTTRSLPFIRHYNEEGDCVDSHQLFFAIREDLDAKYIDQLKTIYGQDINTITFKKTTRGNLETAYICTSVMDPNIPLLILDSDNKYQDQNILDTFVEAMDFQNSMVVTYFDPIDDSSKWAFIYTDGSTVTEIVEKDPAALLRGGSPLVGTFWFNTTQLFSTLADFIIQNGFKSGEPGKEEFYVSQVPSLHCRNSNLVFAHKVDDVIPLGTPDDVEKFRKDYSDSMNIIGAEVHPGMQVKYNDRMCTILSIDGPASATMPLSAYPMTIRFHDDETLQSHVYPHQLKG